MWNAPKVNWLPGDGVTEGDMNRIEGNIYSLQLKNTVKVPATGWSSSAPYTITVAAADARATDSPVLAGGPDPGAWASASAASVKAAKKAWGYVDRAVVSNGNITLYCYRAKPAADFWISIKGV